MRGSRVVVESLKLLMRKMGFELVRLPNKTYPGQPIPVNFDISGPSGVGKSTLTRKFCATSGLRFTHVRRFGGPLSASELLGSTQDWHLEFLKAVLLHSGEGDGSSPETINLVRKAIEYVQTDILYNHVRHSEGGYAVEAGIFHSGPRPLLALDDRFLGQAMSRRQVVFLQSRDPEFVLRNIRKRHATTGTLNRWHAGKSDSEVLRVVRQHLDDHSAAMEEIQRRSGVRSLILFTEDGLGRNVAAIRDFCLSFAKCPR